MYRFALQRSERIAHCGCLYYNTVMENQDTFKDLLTQCWIVGVSGGSDSMALLELCRRHGVKVHAAHVNYHHRDSADRDQAICEQYCAKWEIPFHVHHAQTDTAGNFQANARLERYRFFSELCKAHCCAGVLIAHQQDDALETYQMQKQRGSLPTCYGLQRVSEVCGVKVVRPLLACPRAWLREYCHRHGVSYGEDESNFSDDYERNRVRHHLIERLDAPGRKEMLAAMQTDNAALRQKQQMADAFLSRWDQGVCTLLAQKEAPYLLQRWVKSLSGVDLSYHAQQDLLRRLRDGKAQWSQRLNERWQLKKEYGRLVVDTLEMCDFSYTYDTLCYVQTPQFSLCAQGERIEGVTLSPADFPITIRNAQSGDAIRLRFGTKRLNRWFIDRRIPAHQRKCWPVMVNAAQEVIFVAKIGCDVAHFSNNPNLFMIQ